MSHETSAQPDSAKTVPVISPQPGAIRQTLPRPTLPHLPKPPQVKPHELPMQVKVVKGKGVVRGAIKLPKPPQVKPHEQPVQVRVVKGKGVVHGAIKLPKPPQVKPHTNS